MEPKRSIAPGDRLETLQLLEARSGFGRLPNGLKLPQEIGSSDEQRNTKLTRQS
jgi:hypothetical protein